MPKYDPLEEFLMRAAQEKSTVILSFDEIEAILGAQLPAASRYRAWWSNNPGNSAMTRAWLRAGFVSEKVEMDARRLTFRHDLDKAARHLSTVSLRPRAYDGDRAQDGTPPAYARRGRHPLVGALRGAIRIAPGTDLAQPADPDWGSTR